TAPSPIYTLSLHDALPIFRLDLVENFGIGQKVFADDVLDLRPGEARLILRRCGIDAPERGAGEGKHHGHAAGEQYLLHHSSFARSEEHTSELQSRENLVCR